jgi:hypothetical protein
MRAVCCWLLVLCGPLAAGCGLVRLYPPVAVVEYIEEVYPDPRPQNCTLAVLSAPPSEPHKVFARVVSYAGSAEMAEKMQALIRANACEIGADALVLLPLQHGTHVNTEDTYPDWVLEQGNRSPHWVDKRYSVSQRGFALVFKKGTPAEPQKPGS